MLIWLCLTLIVIVGLLWWLVPKGTVFHELFSIIHYWVKIYSSTNPDSAEEQKYSFGNHARQYLLFYTPKKKAIKNKVVMYLHGGGWIFGSPEGFRKNAFLLAEQGYAVIMPAYRKLPFYNSDTIREDAFLAVKKSFELMDAQGWTDKQLVLAGMSAGGNLAALVFLDQPTQKRHHIPSQRLAGLLALGAPLHLAGMARTLTLRTYAGARNSEQYRAASPISFIGMQAIAPILCIHGTKDGLVRYESTLTFVETFKDKEEQDIQLLTIEGNTHIDIASWSLHKTNIRTAILNWLNRLDEGN